MNCPSCNFEYTYEEGNKMVCAACQFSWDPNELASSNDPIILDSNQNPLQDGDDVIIIKDLDVKGASQKLKQGTKVSNIRLVLDATDGHNINCKLKEFGQLKLKSEFVKKVS